MEKGQGKDLRKKGFRFPHGYVIIFIMLIVVALMTYVVPAGVYERVTDPATGRQVVDPNTFAYVNQSPVSILEIPTYIVTTMIKQSNLVFLILVIAGAIEVIMESGVFTVFGGRLAKFCAHPKREKIFIPLMMIIFCAIGLTQSPDKMIGFALIGIYLALAAGYDIIVGISIVLLAVCCAFSAGPVNNTTQIAQEMAGLPLLSGLGPRFAILVVLMVITMAYVMYYGNKVKKDPTKSLVYGEEISIKFEAGSGDDEITPRHWLVLALFVAGVAVLIYGCLNFGWSTNEMTAFWIWMTLIEGAAAGFGPSKISKVFIRGLQGAVGAALVVAIASTISSILSAGQIIDTCVRALANGVNALPPFLKAPAFYVANVIINTLVPSGLGQAGIVMPIMAPLGDLTGVARQTVVTAYKLGDGLSNIILPHSSGTMGFIAIAGIPFTKWFKFAIKLMGIYLVVGCVIMVVCGSFGV